MLLNHKWVVFLWSWQGLEAGAEDKKRLGDEPITWEKTTDFPSQLGSQLCVESTEAFFQEGSPGSSTWAFTGSTSKSTPSRAPKQMCFQKGNRHFTGDTPALCLPAVHLAVLSIFPPYPCNSVDAPKRENRSQWQNGLDRPIMGSGAAPINTERQDLRCFVP